MKKLLITIALVAMSGSAAYAASVDVTCAADGKTVNVEAKDFAANSCLGVHITGKDGKIEFEDEFYTDKDGALKFSYLCKGDSGNYTALVYEAVGENEAETEFMFISKAKEEEILAAFAQTDDLTGFFAKYSEFLETSGTQYDDVADKDKCFEEIKKMQSQAVTTAQISKAFYKAVFCARVNETKSAEVLEALLKDEKFDKYIGISKVIPTQGETNALFAASSSVKDEVLARMAESAPTDADGFLADLTLDLFKTTIAKAEYYTEVRNILQAYGTAGVISVDVTKYDSKSDATLPFKAMMKQTYASYDAAVSAFNNYSYPSQDSGSGGGGGSSGGSSSGSAAGIASPSNGSTAQNTKKYPSDMANVAWAEEAMRSVYDNGIMVGDADGKFRPTDKISRAELAVLICKIKGLGGSTAALSFGDVPENSWYFPYVSAAYHNGLFMGKSDSIFEPNAELTREEMTAVLQRIGAFAEYEGDYRFDDDGEISSWAKESVYALYGAGIVSGSDGKFLPKSPITRAEAAVMIYRMGEYR